MILVRTDWPTFEMYLASLSKPARKNYKESLRRWGGLSFREVPFNKERTGQFMRLWERQLVKGEPIQWAYPLETVEGWSRQGVLRVFEAGTIGMQFIVQCDGYWQAEPVMLDKKNGWLSTYMWFSLIRFLIENHMAPLNLGGMSDDWRENLHNWRSYKHLYKFRYVPERAKLHPDSEPPFYMDGRSLKLR